MRIPPGITAGDFGSAVTQFEQVVGKEWVFTSDEDLNLYRDAYSPLFGEPEERVASGAVAPNSVEQVQQVVKIANTYKIPIYPISTGRNLGYGGAAPAYSGSVVLDLKRMNRILEVSERNASCLVEPGVSYFDLCKYIEDRNLKLWVDVPDPGWGSVIGNALDHGGGYTTALYRNHFDAHCGMEVVLANGEVIRTGMGALPGAGTWQQFKFGVGPWIDGIFSQSNFGIVTKMGFWLMPIPDAYLSGTVSVPRHNDLIRLVDILTYIENAGVSNGMPMIGMLGSGFPGLGGPRDKELGALLARPGGAPPEEIERLALQKGIPYWNCSLRFYGPAKAIAAQWEHTKEKFSAIPGATFQDGELLRLPLTPEQRQRVHKPEFGIPSLEMFSIGARSEVNPNPTNGHMWFSPIIPRTGEAVFEAQRVLSQAARDLKLPFNISAIPTMYWLRAFVLIIAFPITRDIATNTRNRDAFNRLVQIAAEHGWGEYRTAPVFMDAVAGAYSYNSHALMRFHETIKDAVDPNGIISAGRYGIWPKHLRGNRA
ncbi:MAG TPA: FAD-binding oxidoreductase [Vicinamibacterales bacterium]